MLNKGVFMRIIIRRIRKEDLRKACNVVKRAQRITLAKYYPEKIREALCRTNVPSRLLRKIKKKGRKYFVAVDPKGKVYGIIGIKGNELRKFFVDPEFQGKGIGRKLYERCVSEAKKKYTNVGVSSSLYAVPIYKRFGFKSVNKIKKHIEGIPFHDIWMEKKL